MTGQWQPNNWNPETVTSNQASSHSITITEMARNFRCHHRPSPASSLRLMDSDRNTIFSQLLTVNTLSNSFSALCLKEHRISMSLLIYPHNSRFVLVCRCRKGGRKVLQSSIQSSSPLLPFLNHVCTSFYRTQFMLCLIFYLI